MFCVEDVYLNEYIDFEIFVEMGVVGLLGVIVVE